LLTQQVRRRLCLIDYSCIEDTTFCDFHFSLLICFNVLCCRCVAICLRPVETPHRPHRPYIGTTPPHRPFFPAALADCVNSTRWTDLITWWRLSDTCSARRLNDTASSTVMTVPPIGSEFWHVIDGTKPFRSRANSLPGVNRPIGLWPIRSLALSFPSHFAPWKFRSVALSLRTVKVTIYCEKNSYKEIKVT